MRNKWTNRKLKVFTLICAIMLCKNSYAMWAAAFPILKYGIPALPFLTTFVYHIYNDRKLSRVDKNVKDLKKDTDILKKDAQDIKKEVGEVKKGVSTLQKDAQEVKQELGDIKKGGDHLQESLQNFKVETSQNFDNVAVDISVAKTKLLEGIVNSKKILSDLIVNTDKSLRKDLNDKYEFLTGQFESVQKALELVSTKEGVDDLKNLVGALDAKINNVRETIILNIKESEARQNIYFREQINNLEKSNNRRFAQLRAYIKKIDENKDEVKDLLLDNNQKISNLDVKVTKIGGEVGQIKKLLIET